MELIMTVFLYILLPMCLLILLAVQRTTQQVELCQPPGPRGIPLFGNALSVRFDRLDLSLFPLAQKYGEIFQINILGRTLIVLNDVGTIRKALLGEIFKNIFKDRAEHFTGKYIMFDYRDIVFAKFNDRTATLRKILRKCIKVHGEGSDQFEKRTHDELHKVILELQGSNGSDIDIVRCLRDSTAKWMVSLVTAREPDIGDAEVVWNFINAMEHLFNAGWGMLLQSFPFVRYLPGKPGQIFRSATETRDLLLNRLFNTKSAVGENSNNSKERTGLLAQMIQQQKHENSKAGYMVVDDLRGLGVDLFLGGVDTTVTALKHTFAFLIAYPDCAKTIQKEIDQVVGRSREPSINDKGNMPLLMAFLLESQRFTTQAPLGIPLSAKEDIIFEGYNIRKDTTVLINYWFVHHDERIWGDPWNFRPQRFLDSTGQLLPQDHRLMQALMPFGIGPRSCPGQVLGMNRVFLFVATILQCFNIYPSATGYVPETDPRLYKIRISPEIGDYRCRFELRK